jgi:hypothetical protein
MDASVQPLVRGEQQRSGTMLLSHVLLKGDSQAPRSGKASREPNNRIRLPGFSSAFA